MARTTKLNDLQLILLSTAAQRDDGSLLPPPNSIDAQASRINRVIPPLLRHTLVQEVAVTGRAKLWREEGDQLLGLVITDDGRRVIGVGEQASVTREPQQVTSSDEAAPSVDGAQTDQPAQQVPRSGTKAEQVLGLLRRPDGATLHELVDATGWLPHTTRAALTGMRKKGHGIAKTKRGEQTCYRIGAGA